MFCLRDFLFDFVGFDILQVDNALKNFLCGGRGDHAAVVGALRLVDDDER